MSSTTSAQMVTGTADGEASLPRPKIVTMTSKHKRSSHRGIQDLAQSRREREARKQARKERRAAKKRDTAREDRAENLTSETQPISQHRHIEDHGIELQLSPQARAANAIRTAWKSHVERDACLDENATPECRKATQPSSKKVDAMGVESEGIDEGTMTTWAAREEPAALKRAKDHATASVQKTTPSARLADRSNTTREPLKDVALNEICRQQTCTEADVTAATSEGNKLKILAPDSVQEHAELEARLLTEATQLLQQRQEAAAQEVATETSLGKADKMAQIRPLLRLPPSRKHATAGELKEIDSQSPPQMDDDEDTPRPSSTSPYPCPWELLGQMHGLSLPLRLVSAAYEDLAGVEDEGVMARAGEEFAWLCGFSAAFGPLLLVHAARTVFGRVLCDGLVSVGTLPAEHVAYMFGAYWDRDVVSLDPAERLFRLVGGSGPHGGIRKDELRPFIAAIAGRHPDLSMRSPDEVSQYVDTVMGIIFYKFSRGGVIRLRDLRRSGIAASINAIGRLEEPLEESDLFSWRRHEHIRGDFISLCTPTEGTIGSESLRWYRQAGGRPVGIVRASRVLEAGHRPCPEGNLVRGGVASIEGMNMHRQSLGYDAWVCFFLCEEALRAGDCTERDIHYVFEMLDGTGHGCISLKDCEPFFEEMKYYWISTGEVDEEVFPPLEAVVSQYFDAMGVERQQDFITLTEMIKPCNVRLAGRFFEEIFSGTDFEGDGAVVRQDVHVEGHDSSDPIHNHALHDDHGGQTCYNESEITSPLPPPGSTYHYYQQEGAANLQATEMIEIMPMTAPPVPSDASGGFHLIASDSSVAYQNITIQPEEGSAVTFPGTVTWSLPAATTPSYPSSDLTGYPQVGTAGDPQPAAIPYVQPPETTSFAANGSGSTEISYGFAPDDGGTAQYGAEGWYLEELTPAPGDGFVSMEYSTDVQPYNAAYQPQSAGSSYGPPLLMDSSAVNGSQSGLAVLECGDSISTRGGCTSYMMGGCCYYIYH